MKKRKGIAKALALLALVVTLVAGLGMSAEAAKHSYGWITSLSSWDSALYHMKPQKSITIQVEAGQTFNLAEFFAEIGEADYYYVNGSKLALSFKSNKASVASVNKKTGKVTAKKKGTAVITCTYKKKNYTCTLKVLKKGGLGSKYKKINTAAGKLIKYDGKKLTSKNIVNAIKAEFAYQKALGSTDVYPLGFVSSAGKTGRKISNKLAVPGYVTAADVEAAISDYAIKNEPVRSGKLKLSSVSGTAGSNSISVTLNRAPTQAEIYMLQVLDPQKTDGKKVSFGVGVNMTDCLDKNIHTFSSENYYGTLTLTKGSKTAKITNLRTWDNKKVKLKKNYEYTVEFSEKSSKKFVVKK